MMNKERCTILKKRNITLVKTSPLFENDADVENLTLMRILRPSERLTYNSGTLAPRNTRAQSNAGMLL